MFSLSSLHHSFCYFSVEFSELNFHGLLWAVSFFVWKTNPKENRRKTNPKENRRRRATYKVLYFYYRHQNIFFPQKTTKKVKKKHTVCYFVSFSFLVFPRVCCVVFVDFKRKNNLITFWVLCVCVVTDSKLSWKKKYYELSFIELFFSLSVFFFLFTKRRSTSPERSREKNAGKSLQFFVVL